MRGVLLLAVISLAGPVWAGDVRLDAPSPFAAGDHLVIAAQSPRGAGCDRRRIVEQTGWAIQGSERVTQAHQQFQNRHNTAIQRQAVREVCR